MLRTLIVSSALLALVACGEKASDEPAAPAAAPATKSTPQPSAKPAPPTQAAPAGTVKTVTLAIDGMS